MKKFFQSLVTDREWDADVTKVAGLALMLCGLVGFFIGKPGFEWLIGFGAAAFSSGKFSKEG